MSDTTTAMEKAQAHLDKRGKVTQAGMVKDLLEKAKGAIAAALPRHMTPERMVRIAYGAISRTPKLLECEPLSLVRCVVEASELGLEPSGILGHAYLVPYRNGKTRRMEAQLQIGYRGFIELAGRSGRVLSITAAIVHEGDEFDFQYGTSRFLKHKPSMTSDGKRPVVCAYAVVEYKDGGFDFEVLSVAKINESKEASKSAKYGGPWETHWEEMAAKTAIRKLAKRLPLSPEMQRTAIADEYREAGATVVDGDFVDLAPAEEVDTETGEVTPAAREPGQEG